MIIVYDLLTDQKINLVHHEHEITSLIFTPPGAGNAPSTNGSGGEFLISVDLNRNDMSDMSVHSHSTMCLWNWAKGQCLQEVQVPRSSNYTSMLLQPNLSSASPSGKCARFVQILFEKIGGNFLVLDSSSSEINGGGYRVTVWNLGR